MTDILAEGKYVAGTYAIIKIPTSYSFVGLRRAIPSGYPDICRLWACRWIYAVLLQEHRSPIQLHATLYSCKLLLLASLSQLGNPNTTNTSLLLQLRTKNQQQNVNKPWACNCGTIGDHGIFPYTFYRTHYFIWLNPYFIRFYVSRSLFVFLLFQMQLQSHAHAQICSCAFLGGNYCSGNEILYLCVPRSTCVYALEW